MLPDIDLDNEKFDDILDNARNMIVSTYPEWTDFNYHDPGITMLEMFAWLKESQQYYLNKIGPDNIRKYLKLLGLERRTKVPSVTDVSVLYENDITAVKGTKLFAGDICFEADRRTYISSASIDVCVCDYGDEMNVIAREQFYFGGNLRILPFTKKNRGVFYIGFDKPLAANEVHTIWFDVASEDGVERNPLTDRASFIPLVDMEMEYFDGLNWCRLKRKDDTCGFLFSGRICFCPPTEHHKCSVGGHEAYYIRFSPTGGEYDAMPVIKYIYFNLLPVTQRDTRAEYADLPAGNEIRLFTELAATGSTRIFLKDSDGLYTPVRSFEKHIDPDTGEVSCTVPGGAGSEGIRAVNVMPDFAVDRAIGFGTGLPYQKYDLDTGDLEYASFAIMTELPDSGGRFVEWRKVKDFSAAGTDDFVYMLDTENGIITFGDCINGMAPEGEIFIIGYSLTRGAEGCVTKGKINEIGCFDKDEIYVENLRASTGGLNEETIEDCFLKAQKLLRTTDTIVTDEDCENCVAGTQGLRIEKSKVIKTDGGDGLITTVVVKPYSEDGMGVPGERYIKNILAALEPRRMLGAQFRIVRPEYAEISVYADVTVSRNYSGPRETVRSAVAEFFRAIKDDFGAEIIYSKLYELIDTLDCVLSVNVLTMQAEGSNAERTREGDLILAQNVAAYLTDIDIMINV
ncbi:MAG: baseplate J/gp47 family protein [Ruminiclostridium sp.]|nr:baseplate J/gp47 family protein [Ruminiclostridium sp.]